MENINDSKRKRLNNLRKSDSGVLSLFIKYLYYKLRGKDIWACRRTMIRGLKNIETNNRLYIGTDYVGFIHKKDWTYLNIQGKFKLNGRFGIGRGCRLDIGKNAIMEVGDNSYVNPLTKFVIMNKLHIGTNSGISWDCQLLDDDLHMLDYDGRNEAEKNRVGIYIGDNVWIGSRVSIYKGAKIPNGTIVAANTVVKDCFEEENILLAGNPARIIKRNVRWWSENEDSY